VRQIAHAYADKEPYAGLLVRTLRKPVEDMMKQEHDHIMESLVRMRQLSANYTPPESACVSHRLNFSLLRELDNDLAQHFYLENKILFPRAIAMEKELLKG
jgi:regulator of cell morphogenesis and NO signaling